MHRFESLALLLFFFAGQAEAGDGTSAQALKSDGLFANFAQTKATFFDTAQGAIDLGKHLRCTFFDSNLQIQIDLATGKVAFIAAQTTGRKTFTAKAADMIEMFVAQSEKLLFQIANLIASQFARLHPARGCREA